MNRKQRRHAEQVKTGVVGSLAGTPFHQTPDGAYRLDLREAILVTLEADMAPALRRISELDSWRAYIKRNPPSA